MFGTGAKESRDFRPLRFQVQFSQRAQGRGLADVENGTPSVSEFYKTVVLGTEQRFENIMNIYEMRLENNLSINM